MSSTEIVKIKDWKPVEYVPKSTRRGSILVLVDSKLWAFLKKSYQKKLLQRTPRPWIGLLGMDSEGLVKMVVRVDVKERTGGCSYMPAITVEQMQEAALKLAVRGLTICGMLRMAKISILKTKDDDGNRVDTYDNKGVQLDIWKRNGVRKFFLFTLCIDGVKIETPNSWTARYPGPINGYKIIHNREELLKFGPKRTVKKEKDNEKENSNENKEGGNGVSTGSGKNVDSSRTSGRSGRSSGNVRAVDRTDSDSGAEQANHTEGVPQQASSGTGFVNPREQGRSQRRLHPADRGRGNDDRQSLRGQVVSAPGAFPLIPDEKEIEGFDIELLKKLV